jgi:hypothetical protein
VSDGSITVVGESPGVHRVWLWQNVFAIAWYGKPSAEAARQLGPIAEQVYARASYEKFSYVHLVANKLELPDPATRTALLDLTHGHSHRTACVAVIVSGAGFWASAIRSFVTGIRVLAPRGFDLRMHAALSELGDWLPEEHARKTGVTLEPSELIRQLERTQL